MTNHDHSKPQSTSKVGRIYSEETVVGMQEDELDTSAQTLIGEEQDLNVELAETSLRPKQNADGFQFDTTSVGQRLILPREEEHPQKDHADYMILDLLGEGGMGQVHLARQIALGRNVAVKQLRTNPQQIADQSEFLVEAVVTGKLEHPNIVPIYEVGKNEQGDLFYSMKNVQGQPWSELMDEMSLIDNLEVLLSVCDAMAFAHSQGVIHRDLKPANIMVGGFGEVLVMDWGLAMLPVDKSAASTAICGTPAYMAPEMVSTPERANARSDVYLLGGILFRILSGHAPHTGKSARDSLLAASRNEIAFCSEERRKKLDPSGELLELSLRSMKADLAKRFSSVNEFQHALHGFLQHRDSLELSARAEQFLKRAKESGDYTEFSRAVFGFEEALKLWSENELAQGGTDGARLEWAKCAERQGDFDLCLSLIDEVSSDQSEFRNRLLTSKQERSSRQARLKQLKLFSVVATVLVAVLATGAAVWIDSERDKALVAQQNEAQERKRANEAANLAKQEARRADAEAKLAEQATLRANQEASVARQEAMRADAEAEAAKRSRLKAEQNLAVAERNAYNADMLLANTAWESLNLPRLHEILERYREREDLKGIAWNYFHRQLYPSLHYVHNSGFDPKNLAFSPDGKVIASIVNNSKAIFHDSVSLQPIREIPLQRAKWYSCCFSPDGRYFAVGSDTGHVSLHDSSNGHVVRKWMAHAGGTFAIRSLVTLRQ